MKHFDHIPKGVLEELFLEQPKDFPTTGDLHSSLGYYLGATLYTRGTQHGLAKTVEKQRKRGVTTIVLDLEDAIADENVCFGEENIISALNELGTNKIDTPLLFIRIREYTQIEKIVEKLDFGRHVLSGFVLPKFDADKENIMLTEVFRVSQQYGIPLLALPVLESHALAFKETREQVLKDSAENIAYYSHLVPGVRVGATDLSGTFGLRRPSDLTIYDLAVVRDMIADIVNVFARKESVGVISGCVWEYFTPAHRILKPQLRTTPFGSGQETFRDRLLSSDSDALIHEVVLDKANGLTGKTVIHPSHTPIVHSLLAVTSEEYSDALCIVSSNNGGANASEYKNKMNELRPHREWAQRTLLKADAFGVTKENVTFVDLLVAQYQAEKDG